MSDKNIEVIKAIQKGEKPPKDIPMTQIIKAP